MVKTIGIAVILFGIAVGVIGIVLFILAQRREDVAGIRKATPFLLIGKFCVPIGIIIFVAGLLLSISHA